MGIRERVEGLADQAVCKFIEGGVCMDKTIASAAKSEGLGSDYIDRVVQAANKKAFLRLFPSKHEFAVASKEGVEKLMGQEGGVKVKKAGVSSVAKARFCSSDPVNYNLLTLTKVAGDDTSKEASAMKTTSKRSLMILREQIKRAIEELDYESRRKRADVLRAESALVTMSKQAMLRGAKFGDLETYALSLCDGSEKVAGVIDGVYEKVKGMQFIEKRALCRGSVISPFVGSSNSYTDAVDRIIKIAYEDLPIIENSLSYLKEKLEDINSIVGSKRGN